MMKLKKGFTLIELLVVIGIIGILAAIVLIAVNPGRQFAQARDTQRLSDLRAITDSIYQFAAEHNGDLPDTDGDDATTNFPVVVTCIGTGAACFNLGTASDVAGPLASPPIRIVPTYVAAIPMDPSTGDAADTGYTIYQNTNGRLVASASGELTPSISVER
ncbi:MAG: hypothetical protein US96_C0053G0008 [Candidatus Woesebacteria bacterium GW2011_GWB1_38_5b]|uniref:Uncharacterized protein n=1 Tax=Candidatus Woesebacteria bacterium GW2011_GWB1_38_5b TaxID=1618569 RepID=A0A0G0K4Q2_9BACT|nr:MAG: hypothetical protein US96_C0053G0008 [Candidatus Woesebacteria bacterium GW2011_GWB1_38_5b]